MAEVKLPNEINEALKEFFKNGNIKVYEAGLEEDRPNKIKDRPFFGLIPESETSWLANNKQASAVGSYNLNIGADNQPDASLNTESHKFLADIEKRFRSLQPSVKLIIIDPDVVMGRYATDASRDRSVGKSMIEYLADKFNEKGVDDSFKTDEVYQELAGASISSGMLGNNPVQMGVPEGRTEDNLQGKSKIAIVIGENPDLIDDFLITIPGSKERREQLNITDDVSRRLTIYHELGHALDIWSDKGLNPITGDNLTEQTLRRHKTECLGDVFATLQTARDFKSTDGAELFADTRAFHAFDAYEKLSPDFRAKMKMLGIRGEEWRKHYATKGLEDALGIAKKPSKETEAVNTLEKSSKDFSILQNIAATMAYNVNPVSDVAIDVAKKGLKDGSLLKMTDKEVLELSQSIVEKHAFDADRLNKLSLDILNGNKENPDIQAIEARYKKALENMPLSKNEMAKQIAKNKKKELAEREIMIKKMLLLKVKEATPKQNPEEVKELTRWIENIFDNIERNGGSKSAIVSTVSEEKDKLRNSEKDKLALTKINLLNNVFIAQTPEIELNMKANSAVMNSVKNLDIKLDIDNLSGGNLVNAFIQNELGNTQLGAQLTLEKYNKDFVSMDITQIDQTQAKENQEYLNLLVNEKSSQILAMKIRSDKEAWNIVSNSDTMKTLVTKKALGRPADWLACYHLAMIEKSPHRHEDVLANINISNQVYVVGVNEINTKMAAKQGKKTAEIISLKPKNNESIAKELLAKTIKQR